VLPFLPSSINRVEVPAYAPPPAPEASLEAELRDKLYAFDQQAQALGAAWIVLGLLFVPFASGLGVSALGYRDVNGDVHEGSTAIYLLAHVLQAFVLVWIVAGAATCLKNRRAICVGLAMHYVALTALVILLPIAVGNILVVVPSVFVVLQAHRVIRWTGELTAAGTFWTARR